MKMELTKDELIMMQYSLSGNLKKLAAEKRLVHQELGEDFDEMFDTLIKKVERLEIRLYDALTLQEDQER